MKYRKKPVIIEATQWRQHGDHAGVVRGWKATDGQIVVTDNPIFNVHGRIFAPCIKTMEGWHEVTPGDWIITGVKGEVYPCKPDIFEATYEAVGVVPPNAPHEGGEGKAEEQQP